MSKIKVKSENDYKPYKANKTTRSLFQALKGMQLNLCIEVKYVSAGM